MGDRCFNCAAHAPGRYAIDVDSGPTMPAKPVCNECALALGALGWIDVVEVSVAGPGADRE